MEKRIREDKKHPGVIVKMKRSEMLLNIIRLINDEAITIDDLDGFSYEIIEGANLFVNGNYDRKFINIEEEITI